LQASGFDASIAEGGNGQFDVVRDGELVFSKKQEHRWPETGEVLSRLQG
jgi:predicted Rdx family selenoprotein